MNREELLAAFKKGDVTAAELMQRIRNGNRRSASPLSEGQKGLWLLDKLQPGSSAYNLPACWRAEGAGDAMALTNALTSTFAEHPVLTALIREQDGAPVLVERPGMLGTVQEHDARALNEEQLLDQLRALVAEPFSLQTGPLMRAHLLHRQEEHVVLVVVHHIVADGRSMQLLVQSLLRAAGQINPGEAPSAPVPATRYADFVAWEQALLAGEDGRRHLAYWQQQLAQPLPVLELPGEQSTSRPPHGIQGRTHSLQLDAETHARLRALATSLRVSPAVLFLAVYKLLLQRYSGQHELIVGMPSVGRPEPRFEDVAGYFINMVPVRSCQDPQASFAHFARELQLTLADGLDHAAYPFPALVRALKVPRTAGHPPIFQVAYEYQSASVMGELPAGEDTSAGDRIRPIPGLHQEGEYELVLEVYEQAQGYAVHLKHDARRFSIPAIQRLGQHLLNLLHSVLEQPELALSRHD
ncbi:MAG: condensation domain-containing protein, partial [Rhizobacter sp.]